MSSSDPSIDQRGYANPELLVSTDWLADHLDDPGFRIVDCNFPGSFGKAHIPGAVPVSDNYYKGEDRIHVQPAAEFEQTMSALGISNETTVIAYDSDRGHFSPRLFWALQLYGHDRVKVLDGGFAKWSSEGRPVEQAARQYPPGDFTARGPRPVNALKDDILSEIGDSKTVFWDVRADDEYSGENDRGTARGGRIPGAVHLEWANLVTGGAVPVFKPGDELRALLEEAGVTPDKNIVAY
ncbi:MAG: sulfurtransferase [Chloroflexi bacterium]|nr:sulfurtransferase [Chloroflexota bacterium]